MLLAEDGGNSSASSLTPPKTKKHRHLPAGHISSSHSSSSAAHDGGRRIKPVLSSSQRADRERTAGRRSAIAARENRRPLSGPGLNSSQRADRARTAGRRSAITARENRKSLSPKKPNRSRITNGNSSERSWESPPLTSSQRAERARTAGRRSAIAAREKAKKKPSLSPQERARLAFIEADRKATQAERAARTSRISNRSAREELRASAIELRQEANQKNKAYLAQLGVPWNSYGGVPTPTKPKPAKRPSNSPSPADLYTGRAVTNDPTLNDLGIADAKAAQSKSRVDAFLKKLKGLSPQQRNAAIEGERNRAMYMGQTSYANELDAQLPVARQRKTLIEEQNKREAKSAARSAGSLGLDCIPFVGTWKGVQETITGKDLVTGQKLSGLDRVISGVGAGAALIPIPGSGAVVKVTSKGGKSAVRAIRRVSKAPQPVKTTVGKSGTNGSRLLPDNKPPSGHPPVSTPRVPKPPQSSGTPKPPSSSTPLKLPGPPPASTPRAPKYPSSTPKPPSRIPVASAPHTSKPPSSSTPKSRGLAVPKPLSSAPNVLGKISILPVRRSTSISSSSRNNRIVADIANSPLPTITPLSQRTVGTNFVLDEFGRTQLVEGRVDGRHLGRTKEILRDPWQKPDYGIWKGDHNGHLLPESAVNEPARANISENLISESPTSNLGEKAKFDRLAVATKENNPNSDIWIIAEPFYKDMDTRPYAVRYFLEKDGKIVDSRVILNPSTHSKGLRKGMYWRN